jgi:hypothetical protein
VHVQVARQFEGMLLVPRQEIAFDVNSRYGDNIQLVMRGFLMEYQIKPSKYLAVFEPAAVDAEVEGAASASASAPARRPSSTSSPPVPPGADKDVLFIRTVLGTGKTRGGPR